MSVKPLETRTPSSIIVSEPISNSREFVASEAQKQLEKRDQLVGEEGIQVIGSENNSGSGISDSEVGTKKKLKYQKKWNRRFNILFCCLGYKSNSKDSIADVASLLAEFYADLDDHTSDLAAGFVLLSKYQAAERKWIVKNHQFNVEYFLSSVPITKETKFLNLSTAQDTHLMNDLIYYMNYSLAIFGWQLRLIENPCKLCCLCPFLKLSRCCCGRRVKKGRQSHKVTATQDEEELEKVVVSPPKDDDRPKRKYSTAAAAASGKKKSAQGNGISARGSNYTSPSVGELNKDCDLPIILEDNFCGCNLASAKARLAEHNYEIVYLSYKVAVNVVPFLVAADHSKQSIVVALRGSMNLPDIITDMNGTIDPLPLDNCPKDWLGHRGITKAADYVKSILLKERILEAAFNCRPDLGSQDYQLILCGHSLGAGVAGVLGILLRPIYPSLKAYLYAPPGGLLSLPAVEYTKEFAIGVVLGNDCVPRLGVAQLERLRYQTILSLKSSQKSTRKILAKAMCPNCCLGGNEVDYDPDQSLNLLFGIDGQTFDYNGFKIPFQNQQQIMYVPGRLVHIVKNYSYKASKKARHPIYQAIWSENTMYDRILISEGMLTDHLPNNYMHAMKMLFQKTLPARKEGKLEAEIAINPKTTNQDLLNKQQQQHLLTNGNQACNNEYVIKEAAKSDEVVIGVDNNNNEGYDQKIVIDLSYNSIKSNDNNDSNLRLNEEKRSNSSLITNTEKSKDRSTKTNTHPVDQQTQTISDKNNNFDNNGNDETVRNKNY